ncbi:phage tail sheath subtilisin-like domain-containing protein [Kordiimonas marina]|uniref:phage tail sheath subtilisin-like domain-containing protein n=1 Tax=Kordiimonas marina TaxID=2872312 RepID=UPI001FF33900|nr:phage tail sheath subtilisin-like domain-containing protein [Kordiimonas marina]MCJ9428540.1 phage tail sheath subtilisin-like domain-containing protein [Kordiimonas marina]
MPVYHGIQSTLSTDGIRPVAAVAAAVIGLIGTAPDADAVAFPLNTPVMITGPRAAANLDPTSLGNGTLLDAANAIFNQIGASVIVVRVDEGIDEAGTLANIVGDATQGTGVHAFESAEATVYAKPTILVAPGWTHQRPGAAANPVVAELKGVASLLRAIIVADGPATNDADAATAATDAGSDRVYIVDPQVMVSVGGVPTAQPASGFVAGVIARTDYEKGFWYSPSNKTINGIVGISRPITFSLSDDANQASQLNQNNVATIVQKNGFRLWGNTTTGADPLTQFLAVRRGLDVILDLLEDTHLWALDLPLSPTLLTDVQSSIDSALRGLKRKGATLAASVALDPELNNITAFSGGTAYWNVTVEPPAPLQSMNFVVKRDAGAYETLINNAA